MPSRVLDAGCGTGVISVALAAALDDPNGPEATVRAQDRDELARAFTAAAARANKLEGIVRSRCEPLLSRDGDERFGLIVSNLPAKAGPAVLRSFFMDSARMLDKAGFCAVVIVNTLAPDARAWLAESGASVIRETRGKEHTVIQYGPSPESGAAKGGPVDPWAQGSPYLRAKGRFELLGAEYGIEAIHGAGGFDERGREATVAARLLDKLGLDAMLGRAEPIRAIIFGNDQGHFPVWLAAAAVQRSLRLPLFTLLSRNTLSLTASAHNLRITGGRTPEEAHLSVDFGFAPAVVPGGMGDFDLAVAFPEIVPLHAWAGDVWSAAARLVKVGGLFVLAVSSSEAERFDRVKTGPFNRAGDVKREGFRALAYRRTDRQ